MAATPANELLAEVRCYACAGASDVELLRLAMLRRTLIALVPAADTSMNALLEYSKCYACFGASLVELLELALLDQIAQAS